MAGPISGTTFASTRGPEDWELDDDSLARNRGPGVGTPAPREVPVWPDTDAAFVANAVRAVMGGASGGVAGGVATPGAAGGGTPHPMLAALFEGTVETTTRTSAFEARLDAFIRSAKPTFDTPQGKVEVAIAFRMDLHGETPDDPTFQQRERSVTLHVGDLAVAMHKAGLTRTEAAQLVACKATPEVIRRVTQALIDAGHLPPGAPDQLGLRVRQMMSDYGVGLDCSGYVSQALVASRGGVRPPGFRDPVHEDLSGLEFRGFARVSPEAVRAGDMIIFDGNGGVGHTTIVSSVRCATAEEARVLTRNVQGLGVVDPAKLHYVTVDSSWGSYGAADRGGVLRDEFLYDEASQTWLVQNEHGWQVRTTPHDDEPIHGIYRPAGEI